MDDGEALGSPGRASYHTGLGLIGASTIAWSTAGLFTRLIPLDSGTLLVWRGLWGALVLCLAMVLLEGIASLRNFGRLGWPGWLFTLIGAFAMLCYITSFRYTTVAHVAVIYATVPFIAGGLTWVVLREKPSASAVIASLAGLGGVAAMVGVGGEGGLFGDLLALGMTLSMAAVIVIARRFKGIPTMATAALAALISGLAAIPFAHSLAVTAGQFSMLAAFGIVNSALGLTLFTLGARMLPPIETALIGSLDAPLAPVWVWLFFSETPNIATLAGGAVVFAAVLGHVALEAWRTPANAA
jgi:drug/metabolite transporter (DMT)-like permease